MILLHVSTEMKEWHPTRNGWFLTFTKWAWPRASQKAQVPNRFFREFHQTTQKWFDSRCKKSRLHFKGVLNHQIRSYITSFLSNNLKEPMGFVSSIPGASLTPPQLSLVKIHHNFTSRKIKIRASDQTRLRKILREQRQYRKFEYLAEDIETCALELQPLQWLYVVTMVNRTKTDPPDIKTVTVTQKIAETKMFRVYEPLVSLMFPSIRPD